MMWLFYSGLVLGTLIGFVMCSLMVLNSRQSRYEEQREAIMAAYLYGADKSPPLSDAAKEIIGAAD